MEFEDVATEDHLAPARHEPSPVFVGVSHDGLCVEVHRTESQGAIACLNGVNCEATWASTLRVIVDGRVFTEVARAALEALRNFVAGETASPPWAWVATLIEAGLLDQDVALTERGRRVVEAL